MRTGKYTFIGNVIGIKSQLLSKKDLKEDAVKEWYELIVKFERLTKKKQIENLGILKRKLYDEMDFTTPMKDYLWTMYMKKNNIRKEITMRLPHIAIGVIFRQQESQVNNLKGIIY